MTHFVYLVVGITLIILGILVPIFKCLGKKDCIESYLLSISFSLVYYMGFMLLFSVYIVFDKSNSPEKTSLLPFHLELFIMAILKYGILFFFVWLISFLRNLSFKQATAFGIGFASFKVIWVGLYILLGVAEDACSPAFLSTLSYHYHYDFWAFLSAMRFEYFWTFLVLLSEKISIFFIDFMLIVIFLYAFKRKNKKLFAFVILYETLVNKIADIFTNNACIEILDFSIYKTVVLFVVLASILGIIVRNLKHRWQEDNLKTES